MEYNVYCRDDKKLSNVIKEQGKALKTLNKSLREKQKIIVQQNIEIRHLKYLLRTRKGR